MLSPSFTMGRYPRLLGEGLCYHVRTQCNNKAFLFQRDDDCLNYITILDDCRRQLGFLLNHYVIMSSHVHLIITTPGPTLLNTVMHAVNQKYAHNHHKRYQMHGHFWINNYRSSIIDSDNYALACLRYLDRNPVRAGLVQAPKEWQWSAHQYYAYGTSQIAIDPHPSYMSLASQRDVRMGFYRDFVNTLLPSDEARECDMIRKLMAPRYRPKNKK